jgi:hypothetical protein
MFLRSKPKPPSTSSDLALPQSRHHGTKSVKLHTLCQNCSGFCRQWKLLDSLQGANSPRSPEWPVSKLCTIEHLVAHQDTCHLCKLLSTSLEPSVNSPKSRGKQLHVFLHPQRRESGQDQVLRASVADKTPQDDDKDANFSGSIVLKTHQRKLSEPLQVHCFY